VDWSEKIVQDSKMNALNFPVASSLSVLNRGKAPKAFLTEMVEWAKAAPDEIFEVNTLKDIYSKVKPELGPYTSILHRKAVMLEVMRVLAGFESSWKWNEGVDVSRAGDDTLENSEAGAWQVSYDARNLDPVLKELIQSKGIKNGVEFQKRTKSDHSFAMEFVARLMRVSTLHNGPLYKDSERSAIRKNLRGPEHSIYPWLSKDSVTEFQGLLS
jgi:hypothetical protein